MSIEGNNILENKSIAMVLSGGGVRSLAHIGLLQALNEEGIFPEMIAGTSGGALVGALYASGIKPKEMLTFFDEIPLFKLSLFAFRKPCVMDSAKYEVLFQKFLRKDFKELECSLVVAATNLLSGKIEYFSEGNLIKSVIASSALPPYFSPIEINGNTYADGGILDNFPIIPIQNDYDLIIGSFVNPVEEVTKKDIDSTFKLLSRVYNISMDVSYYEKFDRCNYVFLPEGVNKIGVLESKMIQNAYQIGYEQAQKKMKLIKKSLLQK